MLRPRPELLLTLLALTCFSCGGGGHRPDAPGGGSDEPGADTLVFARQSDSESLISVVYQSASDNDLIVNMFESLTDSSFDCRLEHPPGLAERYEHPEDGLSITYHLRKDAVWSDGTPITAADVAFTYDLIADPAVASPRISYTEKMLPDARPRVLDDHTVRFEFTQAYDRQTQMSHTGMAIVPKHALEKYDRASLRGTDFEKDPVVSGPWKLHSWEKGQAIVLTPNDEYFGQKPTLRRVIFKTVPEYAARVIELEGNTVDMIESFQTVDDIAAMKKNNPEIEMYRRGWRFMDYVGWNLRNPLFQDKQVRQALTLAIDRDKIINDLLTTQDGEKLGKVAVSWITPELCDYESQNLKPFPYDLEKAKQMLDARGWTDSDGDGVRDKNGKPFRFVLLTNTGNQRRAKASIIIQANLKAVGVEAQLQSVESNNFFERLRKKDYEAALAGWSAGLFVDPTELWHSDTPDHTYEFNFTSYSNPRADELIERGMATPDLEAVAPIWQELQEVIYDDQPYTFLYWRDEVVGLHQRVRDPQINILSTFKGLNDWWVPSSEVKFSH
ncbi:MAG: peptide-binding protein [Acidobacteriota bacterium]